MPIYEPDHVEYKIDQGHISIVLDDGKQLPSYFAHPQLGGKFPGVVLIHDWWGITTIIRRMANLFAQMGYYVMVPDLFYGKTAIRPKEAMVLVKTLGTDTGYTMIDSALAVLENHHQCNGYVAAIGVGMGGSLAFEAAIKREDIEAVVAYSGFPHRYFGHFKDVHVPVQAFYGSEEPHITPQLIVRLREELAQSKFESHVEVIEGMGHELFAEEMPPDQRLKSRDILTRTFDFLDQHLLGPQKPAKRQTF